MECSLDFYLFILTYICPQELISAYSHPWGLSPGGGQTMNGCLGVGEVPCVQTQKSPCCHPERCLTCSCFRTRCVCHTASAFPPPNGNKPTEDETHHIPESCCCCPSDTPDRAHLWLLRPNCSFLIGLESFVFSRDKWGTACREIFAGAQIMITAEMPPMAQVYPPNLQPSRAGEDLSEPWWPFTRKATGLQLFSHCSVWGWHLFLSAVTGLSLPPWGRTTLQVALPMMWVGADHLTHFDILFALLRKRFPF